MVNTPAIIENLGQIIERSRVDFSKIAAIHGELDFTREASFALQILRDSDYLAEVAAANPDSLKYAIINVASLGLSLNPAMKEAYLVPRKVNGKKKVCLDPSYRGLANQAVRSKAVEWVQAELVCENDTFSLGAIGKAPNHSFDPFNDRGMFKGAYCVAKLPSGDYMTAVMSTEEIRTIAERSEAYKSKSGPWFSDVTEMFKKTVIRRASKSWPAGQSDGLAKALALDNDANPSTLDVTPAPAEQKSHALDYLLETLVKTGRTNEQFVAYAARKFNREITSLETLADSEINQLQAFLNTVKPIEKAVTA